MDHAICDHCGSSLVYTQDGYRMSCDHWFSEESVVERVVVYVNFDECFKACFD
jgi:hypothetical protein